jgi:hypothetical protein
MNRFRQLYDFIRTYFNLLNHQQFGRMSRDKYESGLGHEVTIELWDNVPAAIYRDGLEPVYEERPIEV